MKKVYVIVTEPRGGMPEVDSIFKNEKLAKKFFEIYCDFYDQELREYELINDIFIRFDNGLKNELIPIEYSDDDYKCLMESEDYFEMNCVLRCEYFVDKNGKAEKRDDYEEYPIVKIHDRKKNYFDYDFKPEIWFRSEELPSPNEKTRISNTLNLRFERKGNGEETIKALESIVSNFLKPIEEMFFIKKISKKEIEERVKLRYFAMIGNEPKNDK